LLKAFSASIEMIIWVLSLPLLICSITFNDLRMLNHPCISGMKLSDHGVWSFCWLKFANILLSIFVSKFIKEIGLQVVCMCVCVCVCVCVCPVWFWDEYNTGFIEWVWQCFFPSYFMEKFEECWC
jgi:hypothetical protein